MRSVIAAIAIGLGNTLPEIPGLRVVAENIAVSYDMIEKVVFTQSSSDIV